MSKTKDIHEEVMETLFKNLAKYVRSKKLAEATHYNWRTVKNELDRVSLTYRKLSKLRSDKVSE